MAPSPSTRSQMGWYRGSRGQRDAVTCLRARGPLALASHQESLPGASSPTSPLLRPLTSLSQRDRRRSRQGRALGGPGRQWGGTQRGTRSHRGPGGGCWLSQRPSRGPRRAGGAGPGQSSSGQGPSPAKSVLEKCSLLGHRL